ncbi:hypothetical protein SAMN06265337_4297 [Hymenobacter gelipurpurascens]|uniref:Uncharacterized protein n=2 Tax=Hymenobacter gelipurpurascens TaxID=89968 RepID=A0A212UHN5_9BACT|nr:hypothetical protein SAMN06265337_4297 [Hymenobacter gelipurpurascens]
MSMTSNTGLSVLYSLRRELVRFLRRVPAPLLSTLPLALCTQFRTCLGALQVPPSFPGSNLQKLHLETEQALSFLEEIANLDGVLLSAPAGVAQARKGGLPVSR